MRLFFISIEKLVVTKIKLNFVKIRCLMPNQTINRSENRKPELYAENKSPPLPKTKYITQSSKFCFYSKFELNQYSNNGIKLTGEF